MHMKTEGKLFYAKLLDKNKLQSLRAFSWI